MKSIIEILSKSETEENENETVVEFTDVIFVIQQRALSCLNNIVLFFPPNVFFDKNQTTDLNPPNKIWQHLCEILNESFFDETLSSPEQTSLCISALCSIFKTHKNALQLNVFFFFFNLFNLCFKKIKNKGKSFKIDCFNLQIRC